LRRVQTAWSSTAPSSRCCSAASISVHRALTRGSRARGASASRSATKNKVVSIGCDAARKEGSTSRAHRDQNLSLAPPDDDDHDCGWKAYAKAQDKKLATLMTRVEELERRAAGHKSEKRKPSKLPPPVSPVKAEAAAVAAKRAATAALRNAKLETVITPVPVPEDKRACPACARKDLRGVGAGKVSTMIEYVRPHFRRRIFQRETLSCRCGQIVTAPAPLRVGEKTHYAPSFVAHLVVSKCNDSIPFYRVAKAYQQIGISISRSTMCDLFHRAAEEARPLYAAALALVPQAKIVHADETSIRQLGRQARHLLDFRYDGSRPVPLPAGA